ncbi:MAG: hypothetical protein JO256_09225, partial [Alphaproteobacteria bacterium]|nr:hypothetical protein [Alphaproteobacteria bacterium]
MTNNAPGKPSRRQIIEAIGGGLGMVGLTAMWSDAFAADAQGGLGHYAGPKLPAKAKHV